MLKEVSIEIIRKCPNNCVHCSSFSGRDCSELLDYDRIASLIQEAKSLGAETICISGGEPFLHERLADMAHFTTLIGMQTYVYTSGIVFNSKGAVDSLDQRALNSIAQNVSKLIFNIEAASLATYDAVMGTNNCFGKMKKSILAAQKAGIICEAHFVPMKINCEEIRDVIHLCEELKISKLSFLRLVLHGRAQINAKQLELAEEELDYVKNELALLQQQSSLAIRVGVPLAIETTCQKCEAATGKLNIKYDGYVYPCEVFKNDRALHRLEGLAPESIWDKPLSEIYLESGYLACIRELSKKYYSNEHCETCFGQYLIYNREFANV